VANVQGIGSVPRVRLERKLGELPTDAMLEIKQALVFALDLETDMENEE
jgi:mRNA interferase MazF